MNKKIMLASALCLPILLAMPTFATESFGGIGLAVSQVEKGAEVVYVIPETPAANAKFKAGDVILSIDGVILKGKTIDETKNLLRGKENKPLMVKFISEGDTLSATLRRTKIIVKDIAEKDIKSWHGNKKSIKADEVSSYATSTEEDKQLVAILQNGAPVRAEGNLSTKGLSSVFVDHEKIKKNNSKQHAAEIPAQAILKGFSRSAIGYEVKSAGTVNISVVNSDGVAERTYSVKNASVGFNILNWDSEGLTKGRYLVTLECNGTISGKNVVLK